MSILNWPLRGWSRLLQDGPESVCIEQTETHRRREAVVKKTLVELFPELKRIAQDSKAKSSRRILRVVRSATVDNQYNR
jgi:hypothetical protein